MTNVFAVDNASILFLALMRKEYTNIFRFTMTMTESVDPAILQQAVDRVYRRFPSVMARMQPNFFYYTQVAVDTPPQVQTDPGTLITMPIRDIESCAIKIFYRDRDISIEAFHALTDGYGAIAVFTTLVAEYLRLRYGADIPVAHTLRDLEEGPQDFELTDDYIPHQAGRAALHRRRYSYQMPMDDSSELRVHEASHLFPTRDVLAAARSRGVTATSLITGVMASSVMELQQRNRGRLTRPVRIMVPVDLRRIFGSRTLRNFSLYVMPTMEPEDHKLGLTELMQKLHGQIREQMEKDHLSTLIAYNVRSQRNPLFRLIPRRLKFAAMRFGYRFVGESNSSVTVTNLGNLKLPEAMARFVEDVRVYMTPRVSSPYGCSVISYGDTLSVNTVTFRKKSQLDGIFLQKMNEVLYQ